MGTPARVRSWWTRAGDSWARGLAASGWRGGLGPGEPATTRHSGVTSTPQARVSSDFQTSSVYFQELNGAEG